MGRRVLRGLLFGAPFALAAAVLAAASSFTPALRDYAMATCGLAAAGAVWVGAAWRGPREVAAMAGRVAELQREAWRQRFELKTTIDFLGAEREIGLILSEDVEFRAILERVLPIVARLLGGRDDDLIEVYVREEGKLALKCAWARGRPWFERGLSKIRRRDPALGACMERGAISEVVGDRLVVRAPLERDGEVIGALRVEFGAGPEGERADRARVLAPHLGELARFIALSLKTPDLYRRAIEDGLTRLASKGHFLAELGSFVERARATGEPLSLVMVDIDHFKRINDAHGHLSGDLVLKGVAEILKKGARARRDLAFRYGGEEMGLLLPGTPASRAAEVAGRLRRAIESRSFPGEKREPIGVTASFGVAAFDAEVREPLELVSRADEALYRAKRGGRNRVEAWSRDEARSAAAAR
jgi:diguanylate cyclase (GGDEF)-like protein